MRPDEITESTITQWESDQDNYSPATCYARMTRGGVQTARELLWNAAWFERRWIDQRELLHPLAQYQVAAGQPLTPGYSTRHQADMDLVRAIAQADNYLNTIRAAFALQAGAGNAPAGGTLAADPPGTGRGAESSPASRLRQVALLQRAAGGLDTLAGHLYPYVPSYAIDRLAADAAALLAWARELEVSK